MIIGLFFFGGLIALGKVEERTSFGLPDILKTIEIIAAGTTGYLYRSFQNNSSK
jgi:hypothetical protein